MTETYAGSPQTYGVRCDTDVMIPSRDGVPLATDIYFPALDGGRAQPGPFPTLLERTPYNKASADNVAKGKYFARRGYVCAIQDVRGRFQSEGEWYPFGQEAPDGYDTVEWLGTRPWSDGQVGTMGDSYPGSVQSALATLNPPHLSTMIVAVGASSYYHSSMRQNGALEQRFLIYAFRMAVDSKEAADDPGLKAELERMWPAVLGQIESFPTYESRDALALTKIIEAFPLKEGATVLRRLPAYERWAIDILTHGTYGDYWKQRGYAPGEYIDEHADVPTLYLGGWYDTYPRNTIKNFLDFTAAKSSDQRLLMGPWTHGQYEITNSGDSDFGTESHIDYKDMRLSWFDHYLKGMDTDAGRWPPVRYFLMGTGNGSVSHSGRLSRGGQWRSSDAWPPQGTSLTEHYLHPGGGLSTQRPGAGIAPSRFTFDPTNPVPTIGGSISAAHPWMNPGAFDQRGGPRFIGSHDGVALNTRPDVLTFETADLDGDVETTGPITVKLWASSSAMDTDFTVKLVDVFPPTDRSPDGLAINITDSIMRARFRNSWEVEEMMDPGTPYLFEFELFPTSNLFRAGHRIRVDVSSSNSPRFDVNPNTGGPLGLDRSYVTAMQTIYHDADRPSCIVLPLQSVSNTSTGSEATFAGI
jgi:putative CocE/NonD family hydrolase